MRKAHFRIGVGTAKQQAIGVDETCGGDGFDPWVKSSDECGQCAAARAPCGSQTRWVHIRPSEEIIGGSFGIPNKKAGYAFAHQEALRSCLNVLVDGPSRQGPVDLAIVGLLPSPCPTGSKVNTTKPFKARFAASLCASGFPSCVCPD